MRAAPSIPHRGYKRPLRERGYLQSDSKHGSGLNVRQIDSSPRTKVVTVRPPRFDVSSTATKFENEVKDSAQQLCSACRPVFEDYCETCNAFKQHHVCDHVRTTSYRESFPPWKQHLSFLPQFMRERRRWPPRISSSVPGHDPYHRGTSCSAELLLHMWGIVERRTRFSRLQRMRWLFPSKTVSTL